MSNQGISPVLSDPKLGVSGVTADSALVPTLGGRARSGGDEYIFVYNTSATQISQGQICFVPASSLSSGYSVTVSNAVSQAGGYLAVGVAKNATIPAGEYGWVVTRGLVQPALDSAELTLTSGANLAAGLNGGFVTHLGSAQTGILVYPVIGVALSSCPTALTTTGKAYFRSPLFG